MYVPRKGLYGCLLPHNLQCNYNVSLMLQV